MTLYLDTSSLVKLYVAEAGSESVRRLVDDADIVATAAIAYPEARAALARRRREGDLPARAFASAKRALDDDWPRYLAVDVTSAVCREAGALAERHALRGYDSVHLAAFLHLARAAGKAAVRFSCFDDRLTRATRTALRTLQPAGR
ncbi:MAG: type II toxin-antitoxin system VapC family toxin [Acidobacteriota bacterium]|nr:type II toxin-antitoxin system VapC family toxin [Acidobacteriota bacterium]